MQDINCQKNKKLMYMYTRKEMQRMNNTLEPGADDIKGMSKCDGGEPRGGAGGGVLPLPVNRPQSRHFVF